MCKMCELRGEGMLWYLNPRNYGRRMYRRRVSGGLVQQDGTKLPSGAIVLDTEGQTEREMLDEALEAKVHGDMEAYNRLIKKTDEFFGRPTGANAQVLCLKDAERVVELVSPVASMLCICRKETRGVEENEKTFTCLGMGTGMFKWERWPERYRGGVKFMTPDEAKEWLRKMDKMGFMHCLMLYGGQLGGLCNCDYPACNAIRWRLDYGLINALIKAHYVAKVDYDLCNGCRDCIQRCQFGAIKYEVGRDKANIDQLACYGCGLCETGCPRSAISLVDKEKLPALKNAW